MPILKFIKRIGWFILKSPQRKKVGWQTLWTDLEGLISVFLGLFTVPSKEVIWVCVGNKNRSEFLIKYLIKSLSECTNAQQLALSVADCGSTDIVNLELEIRKIWKGTLVFSSVNEEFQRSRAFNRAIAQGDLVFVCDADLSVPKTLITSIRKHLTKHSAWFPICQWQEEPDRQNWKWFSAGTGIFAASQLQLSKVGKYSEVFVGWGKEDWDLFFRFYAAEIMPIRTRCRQLYHHWHPLSKPSDFENAF
jgi:hypothetical protein